jgi:DNA mismatch repair protein MutL
MGPIRILDDQVANQIAAGEVVERPSSVVKELVENAIDAGADRIDVAIEEGGLALIRVADNGSGIRPEECELAFQRHATSKIRTGADLFRIRTLGFRGEALPSIAAVSRLECVTAADESGLGRRLILEGGKVVRSEDAAAPRGTVIEVRDLFFNTPARLKYLKTIQTELGHVSDFLYRLALGRPDIAFTLTHNGKLLLRTQGTGDLLQVIAAVYGTTAAKRMIRVEGRDLDYRLEGYAARPELTRANRGGITLIVNGRYIRNFQLANAVLQAYHTLLPINRYPLAVIRVEMEPELVDVNVHPAKLEVRFSKEPELMRFVTESIRAALEQETLIPSAGASVAPKPKPANVREQLRLFDDDFGGRAEAGDGRQAAGGTAAGAQAARIPTADDPRGAAWRRADGGAAADGYGAAYTAEPPQTAAPPFAGPPVAAEHRAPYPAAGPRAKVPSPGGLRPDPRAARYAERGGVPGAGGGRDDDPAAVRAMLAGLKPPPEPPRDHAAGEGAAASPTEGAANAPLLGAATEPAFAPDAAAVASGDAAAETPPAAARPRLPKLYPIGQVRGTYIVAQNDDGLYLIDQHAAHERLNYEYYYDKFGRPEAASQELLVPFTLEFTPSEALVLRERLKYFEQVGVYMEPFGGNTFKVTACPHWFPHGEERSIIEEMAEWILNEKRPPDLAKLREKSAILCSCKASIKANQPLGLAEMERLLDRLRQARNPFTCPHGRPIMVSFSNYELEKMFKRVM